MDRKALAENNPEPLCEGLHHAGPGRADLDRLDLRRTGIAMQAVPRRDQRAPPDQEAGAVIGKAALLSDDEGADHPERIGCGVLDLHAVVIANHRLEAGRGGAEGLHVALIEALAQVEPLHVGLVFLVGDVMAGQALTGFGNGRRGSRAAITDGLGEDLLGDIAHGAGPARGDHRLPGGGGEGEELCIRAFARGLDGCADGRDPDAFIGFVCGRFRRQARAFGHAAMMHADQLPGAGLEDRAAGTARHAGRAIVQVDRPAVEPERRAHGAARLAGIMVEQHLVAEGIAELAATRKAEDHDMHVRAVLLDRTAFGQVFGDVIGAERHGLARQAAIGHEHGDIVTGFIAFPEHAGELHRIARLGIVERIEIDEHCPAALEGRRQGRIPARSDMVVGDDQRPAGPVWIEHFAIDDEAGADALPAAMGDGLDGA